MLLIKNENYYCKKSEFGLNISLFINIKNSFLLLLILLLIVALLCIKELKDKRICVK